MKGLSAAAGRRLADRRDRGMRKMPNEPNRPEDSRPSQRPPAPRRRALVLAAVATLGLAVLGGAYILLQMLPGDGNAQEHKGSDNPPEKPIIPFKSWQAVQLALVVSGQMHGYMLPCGCSEPQYGGLVRREAFMRSLTAKGWPVVGIDIGELAADTGMARQRDLKLRYTLKALDLMGYRVYGLGKPEMAMPLTRALAQYSSEDPYPRPVASSIAGTDKKDEIYYELNVRPYEIVGGTGSVPKVGVVSLTGPDL
jgi:hypothetical protein